MATINGRPVYSILNIPSWSLFLSRNVSIEPAIGELRLILKIRPRWLVEKGRTDEARKTLAWLRSLEVSDDVVVQELQEMEHDIEQRRLATNQSWTMLFTHRPLFNRLWRAALLHFMGQMCGNTSMKYYLPSIFMSLGIERKLALMIGGIESTLKIGCTIFDSMIVDKAGRRLTLFLACVVMSISLFVSLLFKRLNLKTYSLMI